jgi:long-subunit acyl-CoA synthetase (AMP-forming)
VDGTRVFTSVTTRTATTLGEAFLATVASRGDQPAILDTDLQTVFTWREYGEYARRAAAGLATLGLGHQQTVGLLLKNRPEFHIADAGALLLGAVPVSMYNTSSPEQLAHLIGDAGCGIVITESALAERLHAALELRPNTVEHVVIVESPTWTQLLEADPVEGPAALASDDLGTLIYTSGTTGPPKGVQLTHKNILTLTSDVAARLPFHPDFRAISYLPMAHIAERACTHYLAIAVGYSIVCCPEPAMITALLPQVRPQLFFSPPRMWEKLRALIGPDVAAGEDKDDIRRRIGLDRLEVAMTGAAPCAPGLIEYFDDIGIRVLEVYGLSETTGLVSVATGYDARPGAAGRPLPSAEMRLADDDELLVRGPLVMAGYRNRPDATSEAIDSDGWLHTGDLARIEADGQIRIIGRKKEIIINSAGKNMSPNNIEATLKESSPLIGEACVIGNARPYNVALIVPDPKLRTDYASDADLRAAVQASVDRANARLARVEQIKRFAILDGEWLPSSDELTPTLKLKRGPIERKYAAEIEALYTAKDIERKYAAEIEALYTAKETS